MIRTARLAVLIVVLASALPSPADEKLWPGRSPDCWPESRMVHGAATIDPWRKNTAVARVHAEKPTPGEFSPNKGYFFVVEGGNPSARITIYAEKDHLVQITFSELIGLSDVRWINEKLLFMRPWWGRSAATDIIYDVERERVLYAEFVIDGSIARRQFLESCPHAGCECIKKP